MADSPYVGATSGGDAERFDDDAGLLDEALERADRAERALARAQGSFAMTIGQLVIDAGQSPRRMLALPFTLLRMRRSRRAQRAGRPQASSEPFTLPARDLTLTSNPTRVLLPRRVATSDARPSLVVVAPPVVVEALRAAAHVSVAAPHDAAALVRALDPDAVVVHAHAGAPGSAWYPLGEPGEAVRERVLVDVRDACRRLGRPIVLLHDPVFAPGLDPFAATCDLVLDIAVDDTSAPAIIAAASTATATGPSSRSQISSASRIKSATNETFPRDSADLIREADEIWGRP